MYKTTKLLKEKPHEKFRRLRKKGKTKGNDKRRGGNATQKDGRRKQQAQAAET